MPRRLAYLLALACTLQAVHAHAQFRGGAGNGDVRATLFSLVNCASFWGQQADGHARAVLLNPDPCGYFNGSQADGAGKGTFINPDTCGYFDGGRADGGSRATLLSTVSCTAFFSSQRDGAGSAFISCAPLAVSASELYGRTEEADGYLWWYTFVEVNNLGFILQRSLDQLHWTEIGFAPGLSISNTRQKYEAWDREMQPGVNYYRWQQVDLGGSFTYSNIVALVKTAQAEVHLAVYPNPVSERAVLHVHFQSDYPMPLRVRIVDALGHIVLMQDYPEMPSPVQLEYPTDGMASGIYFLNLQAGYQQFSRRFMVQ